MTDIFRSRGISIQNYPPYTLKEKTYWDLVSSQLNDPWLTPLETTGILTSFEKAQTDDNVTAINFHVDLCQNHSEIFMPASKPCQEGLKQIPLIFGGHYRPYTLGVRLEIDKIRTVTYYYYPTIWKGSRYGICGDVNRKHYTDGIKKFVVARNIPYNGELQAFIQTTTKFKGISITEYHGHFYYKLYAKIDHPLFLSHLKQYIPQKYKLIESTVTAPIVLAAVRIEDNHIAGYNYYFLKL